MSNEQTFFPGCILHKLSCLCKRTTFLLVHTYDILTLAVWSSGIISDGKVYGSRDPIRPGYRVLVDGLFTQSDIVV
jgi:hypothetical protein